MEVHVGWFVANYEYPTGCLRLTKPQVPNIPPAVIAKGKELHAFISKKSSAEQFACVQGAVDEQGGSVEPHKQVGAS